MSKLSIYRKRFIPNDFIHLKDDLILTEEENLIITKWRPLRPKKDMVSGVSAYYIDQGIKVSKIYRAANQLLYWYCDIIQTKPGPNPYCIIFEDLLIDVIVFDDGTIKIMDLDELADALELGLITSKDASHALRILDRLLNLIHQGSFNQFQDPINMAEMTYSSSSSSI